MPIPTESPLIELDLNPPRSGTPDWVDITSLVYQVSPAAQRGRQHELETFTAGTAGMLLDNSSRCFDPSYSGSPYYPNVRPGRRIRARVPGGKLDGSDAYLFTMYVERWPPVWTGPEYGDVSIELTDALAAFSMYDLVGDWPAESTGGRVNHVLDAIGWPAGDRVISTGQATMVARTIIASDQQKAAQHLQEIEQTENGLLFVDGQGRVVFLSRDDALKPPYTVSQWTFSDGDYEDDATQWSYDWDLVYNEVTCTDQGGGSVTASDATSQDDYWPRSLTRDLQIAGGTSETADAADFLLAAHKDPAYRLPALVIRPCLDPDLMTQALNRELGDRITVVKTPVGGGSAIDLDFFIESIAHEIVADASGYAPDWTTTFGLVPATGKDWWVFDTAQFDVSTKFAY